ncbi:ABC transporter permease [Pediococcus siamensis]|uniref:ABC transporter permease n=1 Tax=Pediococcus siamensis TaxID=381829 RepID=UPI0039A28094
MKAFRKQLEFDGKRLFLRNFSFLFFSLLMPVGFYLLFTRIMLVASGSELQQFYIQYMVSMITYSGLISSFFSIATILQHDRDQGLTELLKRTPKGETVYLISIGFWGLVMGAAAALVIGIIAVTVNHVGLSFTRWAALIGASLLGQLPLILLGRLASQVKRPETLSLVCNLIVFPMAVATGLWWPLNMLPVWVQHVGKLLPTYFTNQLLGKAAFGGKLELNLITGIGSWFLISLAIIFVKNWIIRKWRKRVETV